MAKCGRPLSKATMDRVFREYERTIMHGGANPRQAFLSILQDIDPVSRQDLPGIPKEQIARALVRVSGFPLPKKYRRLLKEC